VSPFQLRHRGRLAAAAVAAALTVAAVILAVIATASQQHAPMPPPSAAHQAQERTVEPASKAPPNGPSRRPTSGTAAVGPVLARSLPVSLDVPRIGIHGARLVQLGLAADGSIQVPALGANSPAGWFTGSPTPGALGPSVILGHVDSAAAGPSIFFALGTLRPGDTAMVTRSDHTVAVFEVDSVEEYSKADFPTLQVFGNTDRAGLRLITCGGTFNPATGSYESNVVVYAHLTSSHPA
jgi:hypothetical protein